MTAGAEPPKEVLVADDHPVRPVPSVPNAFVADGVWAVRIDEVRPAHASIVAAGETAAVAPASRTSTVVGS